MAVSRTTHHHFEVLTTEELKRIHSATLGVLEEIGIVFQERSSLEILRDAGCRVDFKTQRVYFPSGVVESAVRKAPSSFGLYGRDGKQHIRFGDHRTYFGPNALAVNVLDLNGALRAATLKDVADLTRLADALPNIHEGHGSVHPSDVPEEVAHAHAMRTMFHNTTKPFKGRGWGIKQARDSIRMAEVVAGSPEELRSRPTVIRNINSVSPLAHGKELLTGALEYVRYGLPVIVTPEIQFGGTGPITLAGALVQQNAEVLSFLTLAQTVRPGIPVVYGTVSSAMDMRRGSLPYAAVEAFLFNTMTAQIARFYRLPSRGSGGVSDAHTVDAQAGLEATFSIFAAVLGGVNYVQGAGGLSSSLTTSYAKLAMDNEIIAMAIRLTEGCLVDTNTLALDVIRETGPLGTYLNKQHTLGNLRAGFLFIPDLLGREAYEQWQESGAQELQETAQSRAKTLLETHEPLPLEPEVARELDTIVREVETRELGEWSGG